MKSNQPLGYRSRFHSLPNCSTQYHFFVDHLDQYCRPDIFSIPHDYHGYCRARFSGCTRSRQRSLPRLFADPTTNVSYPTGESGASEVDGAGAGPRRSTVAEATLTGTLNGKPLWLKRRKGARVNQLFLEHDGEDLTRQIAK